MRVVPLWLWKIGSGCQNRLRRTPQAVRAEAAPTTRAASRGLDQPAEGIIALTGSRRCHEFDHDDLRIALDVEVLGVAPETTENLHHPVATPTCEVLHDKPTATVSTSLTHSGREILSSVG